MTTVEENLFFMQLQAAELRLWTNEWDDDELAFQLQIEEALRFSMETWIGSTSKASVHKCCTTGVLSETGFISQAGVPDDHKTAVLEQKLEVESLQQVVDDEAEALREQARLEELRAICDHDAKFVRHLSSPSIPDTRKDHLENPFTFHSDGLKGTLDEAWGLEVIMASMNLTHATDVATSSQEAGSEVDDDDRTCKICQTTTMNLSNSCRVTPKCGHRFCAACLRSHGTATVKNGRFQIPCLDYMCGEMWPTKLCELLLSPDDVSTLHQREVEAALPELDRVYCPFKDCSALNLKPDVGEPSSSWQAANTGAECVTCHRYFCFTCQVPWHSEQTCEEYQRTPVDERSGSDIALLKALAKQKKWQTCVCGHVVELAYGCNHITCRCGKHFCYVCGEDFRHGHVCQEDSRR